MVLIEEAALGGWGQRDSARVWHPFTQHQWGESPIPLVRGKGAYLYDADGKAYLDLVSSWWTNLHGHGHPVLVEAIASQAATLDHAMFAGFTHLPAIQLCEALATALPEALSRFFFSDNGSTAVEVALKMAYQYWIQKDEPERQMFLAFEGGYHGDTLGAMAVGRGCGFHDPFSTLFCEVLITPHAATWENDLDVEAKEAAALNKLDELLEAYGDRIAAFIAEPLIQGAGGMRVCRPDFLNAVVAKVKAAGVLIILDEVFTGFGRTGTDFALNQLAFVPDLLCLSKGLTGGMMPLALTVATQKIYHAFWGDSISQAFLHGHSYTANPIACAAALASFQLLQREDCIQQRKTLEATHHEGLAYLKAAVSSLCAPRIIGTIAAWNVFDPATDYSHPAGKTLRKAALAQGLILRPLGNTLYLVPPYCMPSTALLQAYHTLGHLMQQSF
ncbi:MAG: adenosylmethionine--8-amino-7-oxononanoate transaminase [Vampirovibrionales bacterium]|nr:adenosylmethionine--8-amino-7-oxononanoate transaminase [Vampirovibrionales bacterium]